MGDPGFQGRRLLICRRMPADSHFLSVTPGPTTSERCGDHVHCSPATAFDPHRRASPTSVRCRALKGVPLSAQRTSSIPPASRGPAPRFATTRNMVARGTSRGGGEGGRAAAPSDVVFCRTSGRAWACRVDCTRTNITIPALSGQDSRTVRSGLKDREVPLQGGTSRRLQAGGRALVLLETDSPYSHEGARGGICLLVHHVAGSSRKGTKRCSWASGHIRRPNDALATAALGRLAPR